MKILVSILLLSAWFAQAQDAAFMGAAATDSLKTGLVMWYPMQEGTGASSVDRSGQANTLTLSNSPAWTNGVIDNGLSFDGSTQFANTGVTNNAWFQNTTFTLAFWIKTSDSGYKEVFAKQTSGGGITCHLSSGKMVAETIGIGGADGCYVVSSGIVTNNAWIHVAATFTTSATLGNNLISVYLNGALDAGTITRSLVPAYDSSALYVGKRISGNNVRALLDDVRIYNRAITAAEVLSLYQLGTNGLNP